MLNLAQTWKEKNPAGSAAVILSVLILIFISPSFFSGRFLAPVDITHFVAPYLDITTQMLPWYKLSAQIIHSGHFPFWNIYSGLGLPLLANMQTAIFFPLTWVFYIFNIRFALLAYSFLKLLLMGMFTYWYLKELKLNFYSCLMGAILFTFCGANTIWFLWPLTNVLLILPLSFLLIEKYFNSNKIKFALLLAPVTALGLFAGHPQTFFYVFMAIGAYTVFKCFSLRNNIKSSIIELLMFGGIYLLGLLISAVAVLPFLEYLKLSANLDYRAGFAENPFFLPKSLFLANLIPDFYGNTGVKNFSYLLVPNYGELALGYIGLSGFILALFALGKKMRKEIIFFLVAGVLSLALIYHAPLIYSAFNKLPGFSLNYNNRLLYLWAFFLSVLAAFGLQKILDAKISPKQFKLTWLGFTIFSAVLILINLILTKSWDFAHNLDLHTVRLWQFVLIAAFLVNLMLTYFVFKNLPKKQALTALLILIFLETTVHGMVFMKTSKPENFYPQSPALTFLENKYVENNFRVFTFGDNLLPNIGAWYGINELNDHDTIYLKSNKTLKQAVGNFNYSPEYTFSEPNLNALRFLSVKYLLYPSKEGKEELQKNPADLTLAFSDSNYVVLALKDTLPRVYLLNASNDDDANKQLADLIKEPKSHPIFQVNNFQISKDGTETISYNNNAANYLIMTDNFYPDWVANFAGGGSEKVINAFGLRAIPLHPGQGTVTISYEPKSFERGLEISLGAIAIWLILYLLLSRTSAE